MPFRADESKLLLVITTESNLLSAKKIAKSILDKKLAACISFSEVKSIYWWEGKLEESREVQLTIKTKIVLKDIISEVIKDSHSYKLPELMYIEASANSEYFKWLERNIN